MRYRKAIIATAIIVLVLIVAFLLHSKRISRIDFIQQHLIKASKLRFLPESRSLLLPSEVLLFEDLQKIRSIGYEAIWKDYRYILKDRAGGQEIDPFLWRGNWPECMKAPRKGDDVTQWFATKYGNCDVLFCPDIKGGGQYAYTLYTLKLFGADRITMKDNRFIIAEKSNGNEAHVDFDRARVRDAAMRYGWRFEGESVLHEYGFIMQRKGHKILVPVKIDSGERFEMPAKEIVISRALDELNIRVAHGIELHGAREKIPVPIDPSGPEACAKRFLDLCDVRIAWDEASQQYKIAE